MAPSLLLLLYLSFYLLIHPLTLNNKLFREYVNGFQIPRNKRIEEIKIRELVSTVGSLRYEEVDGVRKEKERLTTDHQSYLGILLNDVK